MAKEVIYTYIIQPLKKKSNKETPPLVTTWMDLEDIILSEITERQILYDITYMQNLKNKTEQNKSKTKNKLKKIKAKQNNQTQRK